MSPKAAIFAALLTDPALNPFLRGMDPVREAQITEDGRLITHLGSHLHELTDEHRTLVMDAFEYHSPTGIGRKPCPPELRTKLQEAAAKYPELTAPPGLV